ADDGDAPAALGPRPEDGEGVVPHDHATGPAERGHSLLQPALLFGEVESGEQQHGDVRLRASGLLAETLEHPERAVDAEVLRRAEPAARQSEQLAVGAHE